MCVCVCVCSHVSMLCRMRIYTPLHLVAQSGLLGCVEVCTCTNVCMNVCTYVMYCTIYMYSQTLLTQHLYSIRLLLCPYIFS